MLRGVNKQQIFFDDEDYQKYIETLFYYKQISGFILYAYCLMGNHIHLLLKVGEEPLKTVFRRIGDSFVYWYNAKYQRTGHLFQDRFRSEPVNTQESFLKVLRYILQNPVAAGLSISVEGYPYSSGQEYIFLKEGITDIRPVLEIMNINALEEFLNQNNEDHYMDIETSLRMKHTDAMAKELILKEFGTYSPQVGKPKERRQLNASIKKIIYSGVSIRQLSRLTGISKKLIEIGLKS
jgi:REP element-mobilizing transposase RayT